ncbi:MAG TPA: transketolase C-terminal domain-containing protein, partial [Xanthomonadaceae bacterium]|nr:transketolase C-terminal domain-containing protein [Xanthomonadaceae bacterium]
RNDAQLANIARGGYVLAEPESGDFDLILIATGSEVGLAMDAHRALAAEGIGSRVVSMPCCEAFDAQPADYRESVLPAAKRRRIAIEAATADYWRKYVGLDGAVIGMTTFGASAPASDLFKYFGITVEKVVEAAKALLAA